MYLLELLYPRSTGEGVYCFTSVRPFCFNFIVIVYTIRPASVATSIKQ